MLSRTVHQHGVYLSSSGLHGPKQLEACNLYRARAHCRLHHVVLPVGVQFDQNELAVKLGDIQLMQGGQPLAFDAKTASTYLKETCAVHGTVKIYVTLGKGPGKGGSAQRSS